jgi:hypothetical protein
MNETKHTPGPWEVDEDDRPGMSYNRQIIAKANNPAGYGTVCFMAHGWDGGQDKANARLIAAAPELLEALRGLLGAIDFSGWNIDDDRWNKPIAKAKSLLAKAEVSNG